MLCSLNCESHWRRLLPCGKDKQGRPRQKESRHTESRSFLSPRRCNPKDPRQRASYKDRPTP